MRFLIMSISKKSPPVMLLRIVFGTSPSFWYPVPPSFGIVIAIISQRQFQCPLEKKKINKKKEKQEQQAPSKVASEEVDVIGATTDEKKLQHTKDMNHDEEAHASPLLRVASATISTASPQGGVLADQAQATINGDVGTTVKSLSNVSQKEVIAAEPSLHEVARKESPPLVPKRRPSLTLKRSSTSFVETRTQEASQQSLQDRSTGRPTTTGATRKSIESVTPCRPPTVPSRSAKSKKKGLGLLRTENHTRDNTNKNSKRKHNRRTKKTTAEKKGFNQGRHFGIGHILQLGGCECECGSRSSFKRGKTT
jgi:hypothetical protein